MSASFSQPFDSALARTRRVLFENFDPGRYLTIGFVAFLALLADGCTPSLGGSSVASLGSGLLIFGAAPVPLATNSPLLLFLLLPLGVIAAGLAVLALWLSARGQLIFIESVVYENTHFREPWERLADRARPLFVWTLGFAGVTAILMAVGWAVSFALLQLTQSDSDALSAIAVVAAIGSGIVALALALVVLVIWVALNHFVVPLFYRDGGTIGQAWRKFGALFRRKPFEFALYAVALLLLHVGVQIVVAALIVATCCIIDPLLRLPYLSTLFYLPLLVFLRAYSVEFLGQFGEAYRMEPRAPEGD